MQSQRLKITGRTLCQNCLSYAWMFNTTQDQHVNALLIIDKEL